MAEQLQNDGYLLYYKFGLFHDKWCQIYYKFNSDCTFEWFYDKKNKKPNGSVNLKDAAPDVCIGPQTRLIPFKKPKLKPEWNQNQLIGIVRDKKVYYFYFKTIDNLKQWLSKVIHTFNQNQKETFTSSPYFSKNGKEIRVDHNITTIYNSLDNYLGLYGFGWHFWLCDNQNAPIYGDLKNCHESNHSVQHDETNNHHSHNIDDKNNNSCHSENVQNSSTHNTSNNNDFGVTAHISNHRSTHNHGDFGCYNHSSHHDNGSANNHHTTDYSSGFSSNNYSDACTSSGGGFSSSDCGGGGGGGFSSSGGF